MSDDIERIYLTHDNKPREWPKVLDAIKKWIDEGVRVTVEPKTETRRQLLNRLAHVWRKEIGEFDGEKDLNSVWGRLKFDYLLPLKLADEKQRENATREKLSIRAVVAFALADEEFENTPRRDIEVQTAFDCIRSKDVGNALFAEWLTTIQQVYAEQGLVLTSTSEERRKALNEIQDKIGEERAA